MSTKYYLMKFKHEGDDWLMMEEGGFVGSDSERKTRELIQRNTWTSINLGGIEIYPTTFPDLEKAVGGLPFKIIDFWVGGHHFEAVKLVPNYDGGTFGGASIGMLEVT